MLGLDETSKRLLREVADLYKVPEGAFNIRKDGEAAARESTAHIQITSKPDVSGIDIDIAPGTKKMPMLSMKYWPTS